jgi:3-oxocholest-4-en-26-oyl-CoA dehydrogenase alpha subunit
MNFSLVPEYSAELKRFAKEVSDWLDANVPADMESPRDPSKLSREQWDKRREMGRKLGRKGWLAPTFPAQYGGGGLDMDHATVLRRELAKKHLGLPPYPDAGVKLDTPAILACGTEEQKDRFLPPMLKGDAYTWQLFTEPEAGTDEANQQTNALRAVKEGDHFIVNGQKIFVGGIYAPPDQFYMLTRSDLEAPRHKNLALFVVPANLPGITINHLDLFVPGMYAAVSGPDVDAADALKYSVFFDDVKVPQSCLIGGERDGWAVATATLETEHAGGGEVWVPPDVTVDTFLEECRNNAEVRRRLKENPQLMESVVDVYMGAQIERLFAIRNAGGAGGDFGGPQLEVFRKMYATRLISAITRVLGPYTLTNDSQWGLRDNIFEVTQRAGVCLADGGTPEAMKIGIARAFSIGR